MATICDNDNLDKMTKKALKHIENKGTLVDFYGDRISFKENNIINRVIDQVSYTYAISDSNEKDKWSRGYRDCTGVVLSGIDKKTGNQISILTHQGPKSITKDYKDEFRQDLSESIEKLINRSMPKTIDVLIFGGGYDKSDEEYNNKYIESIQVLSKICQEKLGFEPTVLTGPDITHSQPVSIYLDTKNRRIYLIRPNQSNNVANWSYPSSEVSEHMEKFKK